MYEYVLGNQGNCTVLVVCVCACVCACVCVWYHHILYQVCYLPLFLIFVVGEVTTESGHRVCPLNDAIGAPYLATAARVSNHKHTCMRHSLLTMCDCRQAVED